jgi:hypothetical protein
MVFSTDIELPKGIFRIGLILQEQWAIGISPILQVKKNWTGSALPVRYARAHRNELARATLKGQA